MSMFNIRRPNGRHRPDGEGERGGKPPPFPTMSTFLGLAIVMIALWLLAYGLPHLLQAPDRSVPTNNSEAGASR
ncbi:hypothetical protein FJ934_11010 [Mesorhizobium sp. B2-4-12]|uniref:hypothetical protein n=1 Tax=unclassified Mesorhizobium TaxID=325217 RepID=UPI00112614B0|nr:MULTISPECIES: hypothetical protein [unclassified Mesorhizobium]TPK95745.1 hypothetical protein FJ934_11010 [Mesorhizobium sp. B2-4-12]TPL12592.1 hypothetical protein FJ938_01615 [Mesorhizobium sp. B2-4-14]